MAPRTKEEQFLIDDFIFEKSLFASYWMRIRHESGRLGKNYSKVSYQTTLSHSVRRKNHENESIGFSYR